MGLCSGKKQTLTLRYWKASLAWKNIGSWAMGWTQESFIDELRTICNDNGNLGLAADHLLDDMIHDVERRPRETPGKLYVLERQLGIEFKTRNWGINTNNLQKLVNQQS